MGRQGDLGIRDHGGQEYGMGSAAFGALYPEDLQRVDMTIRCPDLPFVVGMDGKAARMPAGTGELMELQGADDGIIKIL